MSGFLDRKLLLLMAAHVFVEAILFALDFILIVSLLILLSHGLVVKVAKYLDLSRL